MLTVEIECMYFIHNQDILCFAPWSDLYVVLDKKVLKEGETASVTIEGKDTDQYSLQVISSDPSILEVGEDNSVTALQEDEAYLDITVKGKEFDQSYPHAFHISVLPRDVPEIYDIAGLTTAARQGLGKISQPIFIRNSNLMFSDIKNALLQVGSGYFYCIIEKEPVYIHNLSNNWDLERALAVEKINAAERKSDEIIAAVIRPGMSEMEKETALYDYLIQNTQYSYRISDDPDYCPFDSETAYGPIINGTGVCEGYAYALQMLLNRAGIECMTVRGDYGDYYHMWNIVKIDGVYYHADATIDSYFSHYTGRVSHVYFNLSDVLMGWDHTWDASIYPPCPVTLSE